MTNFSKTIAAALIAGASALTITSANAWNGPWGGNMFGIDFGQSTGYGYPGYGGGPWGGNMFGMDFGQSTGFGRYAHGPYGYPFGYGNPHVPVTTIVPQTQRALFVEKVQEVYGPRPNLASVSAGRKPY